MSFKSDIRRLRERIEELEKTCRVQTDALVCSLLIIGEFAQMTKGVIDRNVLDEKLFVAAKDLLEEKMGWLEDHGMTDNDFPLAECASSNTKAAKKRLHLKLVVNNGECGED